MPTLIFFRELDVRKRKIQIGVRDDIQLQYKELKERFFTVFRMTKRLIFYNFKLFFFKLKIRFVYIPEPGIVEPAILN